VASSKSLEEAASSSGVVEELPLLIPALLPLESFDIDDEGDSSDSDTGVCASL
jgi:hypothetical protein